MEEIIIEIGWRGQVLKQVRSPIGYRAREALMRALSGIEIEAGLSIGVEEVKEAERRGA